MEASSHRHSEAYLDELAASIKRSLAEERLLIREQP